VPPGPDWNLWLGPAQPRPFLNAYLPFVWRGWVDFGTGALGDMGCYSFDTIFRVLKLGPCTLGNVAVQAEKELEWDAAAHKIANAADANALLGATYREGRGV